MTFGDTSNCLASHSTPLSFLVCKVGIISAHAANTSWTLGGAGDVE